MYLYRVATVEITAKDESLVARPYELWDLETGNAIGAFATEGEALSAVRHAMTAHGRDSVLPWGLARVTTRRTDAVAHGEALIARALVDDRADGAGRSVKRATG